MNPSELLPPRVRGWIFDLGNTLILWEKDPVTVHHEGCRRVWQWLESQGLPVPPLEKFCEELLKTRKRYIDRTLTDLRQYSARQAFEDVFQSLDLWSHLQRHSERRKADIVAFLIQRYFDPELEAYRLDPGVRPLLTFLRRQGVRLALLSNASDHPFILRILDRFDLRPYFDPIVTSVQVGFPKPHPRAFQPILESWSALRPSEIVMVGDHPQFDIQGAHSLGLRTVWVRRDADAELVEADVQVPDLLTLWDQLQHVPGSPSGVEV